MRKVKPDNMTKPTMKIIMQVFMPYNDGSGGGELVEATDLCFLDESSNDITNLCKKLVIDSKQIAKHHMEIMRLRKRSNSNTLSPEADIPAPAPAPATGLDKIEPIKKRSKPARKVTVAKKDAKK